MLVAPIFEYLASSGGHGYFSILPRWARESLTFVLVRHGIPWPQFPQQHKLAPVELGAPLASSSPEGAHVLIAGKLLC
jgi:hypothetical protein